MRVCGDELSKRTYCVSTYAVGNKWSGIKRAVTRVAALRLEKVLPMKKDFYQGEATLSPQSSSSLGQRAHTHLRYNVANTPTVCVEDSAAAYIDFRSGICKQHSSLGRRKIVYHTED